MNKFDFKLKFSVKISTTDRCIQPSDDRAGKTIGRGVGLDEGSGCQVQMRGKWVYWRHNPDYISRQTI